MKQRLKAIIDACTEQNADNAAILKMLRNMHDEWKEPVMVIECGYIDKNDVPSKEDSEQYPEVESDHVLESCRYEKRGPNKFKVTMIIEECDDEG
jgi:hypothetical protein